MKKIKLGALLLCGFMAMSALTGCAVKKKEVDPDALQIAILSRGFGSAFVYALGDAYEEEYGTKVNVLFDTSSTDTIRQQVRQADSHIDIVFEVFPPLNNILASKNYVMGYDKAFVDLTDIYDAPADPAYLEVQANPELKNRDIMNSQVVEMLENDMDGKHYALSWVMDTDGMMYHKTLWEREKAKLAAGKPSAGIPAVPVEDLELPKTTDEMFALFERIKAVSGEGKRPYAFKYAGQNEELAMLFISWLAQYEGQEWLRNFYEGKNLDGVYTPEIFRNDSPGRKPALDVIRNVLLKSNGYVENGDSAKHIFSSQIDFLEGASYFHFNGSWLDREAATNFPAGSVEIGFMRTPVISTVVERWPSVFTGSAAEKDAMLRQVLDYIDGDTDVKPAFLTGDTGDEILAHLTDARGTISTQSHRHPVLIPAYSEHIDEAKNFLKFMLSKKGQEIMLKSSLGNMMPLNVDPAQFDYYKGSEITYLSKTKMKIFPDSVLVTHTPDKNPMNYLGGLLIGTRNPTLELAFGGSAPQSVDTYLNQQFQVANASWGTMMGLAGVSNG